MKRKKSKANKTCQNADGNSDYLGVKDPKFWTIQNFRSFFGIKRWGFLLLRVALADPLQDVLGEAKKEKLTGNLQGSGGQKTNELAVVLQLSK